MPKMKSNSGAKKRFRFTATGKVVHAKCNKSHILTKKTRKRKRRLKRKTVMRKTDEKAIRRLLPYS